MKNYLVKKSEIRNGILYLSLQAASEKDRFNFLPGQYVTLSFLGYSGRRSPARCFSLVSAPEDQTLEFAIRIIGQFTKTLAKVPVGAKIFVDGPFGNFCQQNSTEQNLIFLAGGIGITPFISMLRAANKRNWLKATTLLFGCKNQNDVPFLAELLFLERQTSRFRVGFFISSGPTNKLKQAGAQVFSGRISGEIVKKAVRGNFQPFSYFLCGPSKFMSNLKQSLVENGVSEEQIFSESFSNAAKVKISDSQTATSLIWRLSAWAFTVIFLTVGIFDLAQAAKKTSFNRSASSSSTQNQSSNQTQVAPVQNSQNQNSSGYSAPLYSTPSMNNSSGMNSGPVNNYQPPRSMMS